MLSIIMTLSGLFFLAVNSIPVASIGLGLIAGAMYREGAFYGMKETRKRKESCHRPK